MKIIKFYRKSQYGIERELIHADNDKDAYYIRMLTGKQTITPHIRADIEGLTNNQVKFEEVIAPK